VASEAPVLLIVDDEAPIRLVLELVLRHSGLNVWAATSGPAALDL
jgi:CheY-like chemotaxis protein